MPVVTLAQKKEALIQVFKSVFEKQDDETLPEKALTATLDLYVEIAKAKIANHELPQVHMDLCHDSYKQELEKVKASEVTAAIDEIMQFVSQETKAENIATPCSKKIADAFSLLKASTIPKLMSFEFQTHADFLSSVMRNSQEDTMKMYYGLTIARLKVKSINAGEMTLKWQFSEFADSSKKLRTSF